MTLPTISLDTAPTSVDHPAATADENALIAWANAHPIDHPAPPVQNHRYRCVAPDGDRERSYTRVTTFARALDDPSALEKWSTRMMLRGLVAEAGLWSDVVANIDDDRQLDTIAESARGRGGDKVAADVGTALHLAMEWVEASDLVVDIPESYWGDLSAYATLLADHGLASAHIEPCAFVTVGDDQFVGRIDRIVATPDGHHRILDVKTGKHADRTAYAVQLAIYSRASHLWTPDGWTEAPMIDQHVGYIAHIPAGTGQGELVTVDLDAAWDLVLLAGRVRASRRKATRDALFGTATAAPAVTNAEPGAAAAANEVADVPFPAAAPTTRDEWITGRLDTLVASTAAKAMLRDAWPTGCPKKAPWTPAQHEAIIPVLDQIETAVEAPFPHRDPEAPPPAVPAYIAEATAAPLEPIEDGGLVPDEEVAPARAIYDALADDRRRVVNRWAGDAKRQGRPWASPKGTPWTMRGLSLLISATHCVTHLWDDEEPEALTRAALALVTGEDLQPTWTTGGVLGSLTIDQAQRLDDIATAFAAGDDTTTTALAEVITRAA